MERFKNKKTAVFLMLIMIVFGTFIGSHRSLIKLYNNAQDVFFHGENGDGFSIQHDLDDRYEVSGYLIKVAKKYPETDIQIIADVEAARVQLNNADTIREKSEANDKLNSSVFALYNELEGRGLSDKDERYRKEYYGSFNSYGDTISNSSYNNTAREFNSILNKFPANILGRLTAIHELDTF